MKAALAAVRALQTGLDKVEKKLKGIRALERERDEIKGVIEKLTPLLSGAERDALARPAATRKKGSAKA